MPAFSGGMEAAMGGLGGPPPKIVADNRCSVAPRNGQTGPLAWRCNRISRLSATKHVLFPAEPDLIPAVFQAVGSRRSVLVGPKETTLLAIVVPTSTGRERTGSSFFFSAGAKNGPAGAGGAGPSRDFFWPGRVGDAADLSRTEDTRVPGGVRDGRRPNTDAATTPPPPLRGFGEKCPEVLVAPSFLHFPRSRVPEGVRMRRRFVSVGDRLGFQGVFSGLRG